jgi:hypothetical protein
MTGLTGLAMLVNRVAGRRQPLAVVAPNDLGERRPPELILPNPNSQVPTWTDGLDPGQKAVTAMNEAEILHGSWGSRSPRRMP